MVLANSAVNLGFSGMAQVPLLLLQIPLEKAFAGSTLTSRTSAAPELEIAPQRHWQTLVVMLVEWQCFFADSRRCSCGRLVQVLKAAAVLWVRQHSMPSEGLGKLHIFEFHKTLTCPGPET